MTFKSLCQSDPLLEFIRSTYGAVPLRVPDQRFAPLAIFSMQSRRTRYLGTLSQLALDNDWIAPRSSSNQLGEVSTISSSDIGWSAATELLGPFMSSALGIGTAPVNASLSGARKRAEGVRVVIESSRKTMVNPFAIAKSIGQDTHRIPATLQINNQDLYIIDGVFLARELSLELIGANASDAAASMEAELVGNVEAERVLRANSTLKITGNDRTPFAFTCLKVKTETTGFISSVLVGKAQPRLNAAPVSSLAEIPRDTLGAPNELLAFDD